MISYGFNTPDLITGLLESVAASFGLSLLLGTLLLLSLKVFAKQYIWASNWSVPLVLHPNIFHPVAIFCCHVALPLQLILIPSLYHF